MTTKTAGWPARAGGDRRRDEPRGRQLPHLLEGHDVLAASSSRSSTCSPSGSGSARRWSTASTASSYVEFVGTGMVATAVIFSSALPAMFGTFVKERFQNTYDAILAAPVDVEELVTAEMLWIGIRAGFFGCFPLLIAMLFGLDPALGDAARAALLLRHRARLRRLRDRGRGERRQDRPVQLRDDAGDHARSSWSPAPSSRSTSCPRASRCSPTQPALPAGRAGPRRRVRLRGDRPAPLRCRWWPSRSPFGGLPSTG